MDLKESMIICVMSLVAFSHEEAIICTHTTMDEIEASQLEERKLEIRSHIHENIIKLLQKKQYQQNLKMRMKEANRKKAELMDLMDIVEESKEMIEDLLVEAVEASNHI
ncbi:hypothetical protein QL285_027428 [Trifolium repens]|nr:hypothetical protein QL285_027424 [Trifolium repens]KAK2428949.1 hypothetical protein QL285_027428 [Trifolium repens]